MPHVTLRHCVIHCLFTMFTGVRLSHLFDWSVLTVLCFLRDLSELMIVSKGLLLDWLIWSCLISTNNKGKEIGVLWIFNIMNVYCHFYDKYLGTIHNCQHLKECMKPTLSRERNVDFVHFQHFNLFFFISILCTIFHLKNVDVYTFWGGGAWESMFCTFTPI